MKKIFTLLSLVMLCVLSVNAADDYRRTWDFRNGFSASTLAILAEDDVYWTAGTSNYESKAYKGGTTAVMNYNGEPMNIPELEGLQLGGLATAKHVNIKLGPTTDPTSSKGCCLWINGAKSGDYVSFKVPAGENVKFGYSSHSASAERGFKVSAGFADENGATSFTSKDDGIIKEVTLINNNTEEATLKLSATSGSHIHYIIIGDGDAAKSAKVGYLYYDAAGNGFESLPLYSAISDMENYTFEGININDKTPSKDELMAYDLVVLDGSLPADADFVSAVKPNLFWQPVVNFNSTLAAAFGFGEPLVVDNEAAWAVDSKDTWFTGFEDWASDGYLALTNGEVLPAPLKLTGHKNVTKYLVAGSEETAFPDSVIAYVYNAGHNSYTYYGVAGDYTESSAAILKNLVSEAVASKDDVSPAAKTAFKAAFGDKKTTVSLFNVNKNAVIYYTTDGSEPTTDSPVYTEPLEFTADATIKSISVADGYSVSEVNTYDVKIYNQANAPEVKVSGDVAKGDATVELSSVDGANVDIWYNFIGSDDTIYSSKYVAPLTLKRAAKITAFAIGKADAENVLVQSEPTEAEVKANMLNVRRDEVAHFSAAGWNVIDNLVLNGAPMEKWVSSNYYFSWGKTASASYEQGDLKYDESGEPLLDENGNFVYEKTPKAPSVTTNTADPDWQLVSAGQVMIFQSNTLSKQVGDFNGYNPERAEDFLEELATTSCVQFGGVASNDDYTASVATTKKIAGPFNVVAVVANVNGDKTTGVGKPAKVAVQVSTDGTNWETVGDTLVTASIMRNYKKFEVAYDKDAEVYVRLASINISSQSVHDIYVFNHGEKSAAEENEYTGVNEITSAEEVAPAVAKYVVNGRVVLVNGEKVYTVAGARVK